MRRPGIVRRGGMEGRWPAWVGGLWTPVMGGVPTSVRLRGLSRRQRPAVHVNSWRSASAMVIRNGFGPATGAMLTLGGNKTE